VTNLKICYRNNCNYKLLDIVMKSIDAYNKSLNSSNLK